MTMLPDPRPDALPEWDDLTRLDHDDHRSWCDFSCSLCEGHRAWGRCTTCGKDPVEVDDEELSICCGSPVAGLENNR